MIFTYQITNLRDYQILNESRTVCIANESKILVIAHNGVRFFADCAAKKVALRAAEFRSLVPEDRMGCTDEWDIVNVLTLWRMGSVISTRIFSSGAMTASTGSC